MAYKTVQIGTRTVKLRDVLRSAAFRKGFDEASSGKSFDYNYVDRVTASEGWRYERGRLFGTVYKGKLKTGNRIENSAIEAYKIARREHLIF